MGAVYRARDDRLERHVALKVCAALDETSRARMWREARTAAGLNHPNICQIHDVGEHEGEFFLAMELLEGVPLSERMARGPTPIAEAVRIMLAVLDGLEVLHGRQIVHRDLKPSNIFLSDRGVKLLDFGLAKPATVEFTGEATTREVLAVTKAGVFVGTPQYASPEQVRCESVQFTSDLFSLGAILYEMISGKRAFGGDSPMAVFHSILYEHPPALMGSDAVVAVDRVIRQALAKAPEHRYASASEMAHALRLILKYRDVESTVRPRPVTRLIVLPFRVLRPHADVDFLAFSLPDAITNSLAGLQSLVVRSSLVASGFDQDADLQSIARQAQVDVVLTGTLLYDEGQLRVATQLIEGAEGTILWSSDLRVARHDVFGVQDQLVRRILESLKLPLTLREQKMLRHDVPINAAAYEYFLRANELSRRWNDMSLAQSLYERCVDEDPRFAPAWARLARCHRMLAKYGPRDESSVQLQNAERKFYRALDINPDLALAHNLYAHLLADMGRAAEAMARLLERARVFAADPELFVGLVHVCRYAGLLDASIAAHDRTRRLDPTIPTSVSQTYFLRGDYQKCIDTTVGDVDYIDAISLQLLGRTAESLRLLRVRQQQAVAAPVILTYLRQLELAFEHGPQHPETKKAERVHLALINERFPDPEGLFHVARNLAYMEHNEDALRMLEHVLNRQYVCFSALARDPWFDRLRDDVTFQQYLSRSEVAWKQSLNVFIDAGGEHVLGVLPRV